MATVLAGALVLILSPFIGVYVLFRDLTWKLSRKYIFRRGPFRGFSDFLLLLVLSSLGCYSVPLAGPDQVTRSVVEAATLAGAGLDVEVRIKIEEAEWSGGATVRGLDAEVLFRAKAGVVDESERDPAEE